MLYRIVRPVARYVLGYYFRNIDVTGLGNVPATGAVIFAANHPTAFLETCLLACYQQRPLHFLARGDLFNHPVAARLLAALNILPVYRIQDGGYAKLTDNYATFEACHDVLRGGGALMILAEGRCVHEKRLRPLRKGTARVALGTLAGQPPATEVLIVPVGVNFERAERFRTSVSLHCGEPLPASDFRETYAESEARGIQALTEALTGRLSDLVVQLPDPSLDEAYEAALSITRALAVGRPAGLTNTGIRTSVARQTVAAFDPQRSKASQFVRELKRLGQTPAAVEGAFGGTKSRGRRATSPFGLLAIVLLLPQLPLWLLAQFVALVGPKTTEFYSPVRWAVVVGGTLLLYPPLFLWLGWPLRTYLLVSLVTTPWALRRVEDGLYYLQVTRAELLGRDYYDRLRELGEALLK